MKNRTFQRLFSLLRMGSILLAAVLFCAALIGVNAQLTVGTNEERNLATYLGLALTAVVTYLLQDVPKMLVGRHFGWKLVRYEAFGRVYQADGTGAFVRVPVPAQSRLRYQPYLLPPEDASRHDVTLYTLCPPAVWRGAGGGVWCADPADAGAAGVAGAVRTGDGRRGAGDDVHSADG